MSTNVNLTVAITGKTIQMSFSVIRVMMTILPLQRLRVQILLDMFLNVQKIGTGEAQITFDYTDINNNTGSMTWIFNFQ